jgi:ABC-2 type transport system permease protein
MFKDSLRDIWYLFVRANKKYMANPLLPFFSLFTPITFLVLFTQLFSAFVNVPGFSGDNYLQFAVAGVLVLNMFMTALQSGASIVDDLNSGFLSKVLATPASRFSVILGRLLSDVFRMEVMAGIILVLAWLMGASFATGAIGIIVILVAIAFFGMAWSGVSIAVGLATRSSETVAALPMVLSLPLLFMSTALVPFALLPQWMQSVSIVNPISYAVDAIRALTSTGWEWGTIGADLGLTLLVLLIALGISAHTFRRVTG